MQWYEEEVRQLEGAWNANPVQGQVIFYGSSSIRLWDSLAEDFPGENIANLGFGGSTLAACVTFFDRLIIPRKPRSLVVYAGDNDLGDGASSERVVASLRALLDKVNRGLDPIPFAYISIKPSPARLHLTETIRRTNAQIEQIVTARRNSCFINVFDPMLGPNSAPRPELYAEDGLHLSRSGYRLWADEVRSFHDLIFR